MVDCIYIEHIRVNCKNGENVVLKVELKLRFCIKRPETFKVLTTVFGITKRNLIV